MLTVVRDNQGRIEAACEWTPVNAAGQPANDGHWVWINQLEISAGVRGTTAIRELIHLIAFQAPAVVGAYWERRDKRNATIRVFPREQLLKEVMG